VKSATSSSPGRDARKSRPARSGCRGCAASGTVVRTLRRPRTLPRHPLARISRSMVHRATWTPCRRRCPRAFTAPYSDSGRRLPSVPGSNIAASSFVSQASRTARRDGGRDRRAWNVRGEIAIPCALSARHAGTTPNTARNASMNAQITAGAGLPPGRKNGSPPSGSGWFAPAPIPSA
jgi:hypothetical protein